VEKLIIHKHKVELVLRKTTLSTIPYLLNKNRSKAPKDQFDCIPEQSSRSFIGIQHPTT
jgi:hypothetical protein